MPFYKTHFSFYATHFLFTRGHCIGSSQPRQLLGFCIALAAAIVCERGFAYPALTTKNIQYSFCSRVCN